jgi:hypothetical protein
VYQLNDRHGRAGWVRQNNNLQGKYIGIELEVSHHKGYQQLLRLLPETEDAEMRPSCEPDGSLNHRTSLEIVFPPYTYADIRSKESFFGKAINALYVGDAAPDGNRCGMHLNINTFGWKPSKKQKFCALINWMPVDHVFHIGGRAPGAYCQRWLHYTLPGYDTGGGGLNRGMTAVRTGRIEVRFPNATVEHNRIANLSQFLEEVEKLAEKRSTTTKLRRIWNAHDEYYNVDDKMKAVGQFILDNIDPSLEHIKRILEDGYEEDEANQEAPVEAFAQAA